MAWYDNIPTFWQEESGRQQFLKDKAFPEERKSECAHKNLISGHGDQATTICLDCDQTFINTKAI